MNSMPFLLEIGAEEIPSQYVAVLAGELNQGLTEGLRQNRLFHKPLAHEATPRRLVIWGSVLAEQTPSSDTVRGPLWSVAYGTDGNPTPALLGFCRRVGLAPGALHEIEEGSKRYVAATKAQPVASVSALFPDILTRAFGNLALPRSMRWGINDYRFIRPVRWLALWIDGQLVPMALAGVKSQALTYGNRTDHPEAVEYSGPEDFWKALEQSRVMISIVGRQQHIVAEGQRLARSVDGVVDWDPELLEEVQNLVEWPTPFLGRFDDEFLQIPAPVLVTSMKVHQRYFPIYDAQGHLLPAFVGVRNGVGDRLDLVVRGNQKVLRARLSDAQYFYRLDRAVRLADRLPNLRSVIFHARMGTYGEKLDRMHRMWQKTRDWWNLTDSELGAADRVIDLFKADLLTHVVQEFPELQGEMGAIYAQLEGESSWLSEAIKDQYRPKSPLDRIPESALGQWLVLLDRTDTLVMAFANGLKPSGSEDPFGLRRAALAIGRVASEGLVLHNRAVHEMIKVTAQLAGFPQTVAEEAYDLVAQRLLHHLTEEFPAPLIRAVLMIPQPWINVRDRIKWLLELTRDKEWMTVAQAFKRVDRVVPKERSWEAPGMVEHGYQYQAVEQALIEAAQPLQDGQLSPDSWWQHAQHTARAVNAVFDQVLIMDPDQAVRERRLALLSWVNQGLRRYFDLSVVE